MIFIDIYLFPIVVFFPFIAAIFIMLIPIIDVTARTSISRFFAALNLIAFLRLFFLLLNNKIPYETGISFNALSLQITLNLEITKYTIFLYGSASLALFINALLFPIKNIKTNLHQVAPFILVFCLNICFGQNDLRVALPVLSIANFLLYFLVGYSEKPRRGSVIFQMGIFLFFCDGMVLILLQLPLFNAYALSSLPLIDLLLLAPGLSRLSLPMFAPYLKKLIFNMADEEAPFIMVFLQLSGILIIALLRDGLNNTFNPTALSIVAVLGGLYIALQAIINHNFKTLPYYFFIFYSSLSTALLFINDSDELWFFSISLYTVNMICFMQATRCSLVLTQFKGPERKHPHIRSIWLGTSFLFIGFPGFGIGSSLWLFIYHLMSFSHADITFLSYNIIILIGWFLSLVFLCFSIILSIKDEPSPKINYTYMPTLQSIPSLRISMAMAIGLTWIVPLVTFYAATKGLK